jgi:diguanylate cyclase
MTAALLCLAAVIVRNFGVRSPVLPAVWDKAYNGAELLALALCGLRAWRTAGPERAAWTLFALGLLGFAAADIYWLVVLMDDPSPSYPSLADAGYLSIYPAAYAGLVLLVRARAPHVSSTVWLDGLVCGLAGAAVGSALVLDVVTSTDGSLATVATNLATRSAISPCWRS